ncbi:metalloregulator ArsR/SmtB family transcription factor [Nocardioides sp. LS1]|uniref:helix-turn-helix transcriptional regulator n=1 Tax=Nocardioides sp. LS1 TaxID=1027620 RepID=UPI000F6237AA|nr:helix-turn-helix domain-containing protein [Nocardioides sp. LS1]GCD88538.1 transcriptional regulator [Nocardioides sp. LS1]
MPEESFSRRVTKLGSLADPVRRALYRFVTEQPDAVSRDQAADGVDVPRHTAKHHLDRLVDEGLLVTEFRRLTGRSGPGAGRPSKLYRRAEDEVEVSLPHRRYDLAGAVLADAVGRSLAGEPIADAVRAAALEAGSRVAAEAPHHDRRASELARVGEVLARHGYEPRVSDELVLANCPFDRIAAEHTEVVCGMNQAFVEGVVERLGCHGLEAALDPGDPWCCVKVRPRAEA